MEKQENNFMWRLLDTFMIELANLNNGDKDWNKTSITIFLPEISYKRVCDFVEDLNIHSKGIISVDRIVYGGYAFSFKKL